MDMINFDCPECGHNLEVDSRGAGFIVKCPECHQPIQIPQIPTERTAKAVWRKALCGGAMLLVLLFCLFAIFTLARDKSDLQEDLAKQQEELVILQAQNNADAAGFFKKLEEKDDALEALQTRLRETDEEWEATWPLIEDLFARLMQATDQLDVLEDKLLKASREETMAVLRTDLGQQARMKKEEIPAPQFTDAEPGKGFQGKNILFPELRSPAGKVLLKDAEPLSYVDGLLTFKTDKSTVGYKVSELHPGVIGWLAGYLPVDPLLGIPERNWAREAQRILATRAELRKTELNTLHQALFGQPIPPPPETP